MLLCSIYVPASFISGGMHHSFPYCNVSKFILPVRILVVSRDAPWDTSRSQRSHASHMTHNWVLITATSTRLGEEYLKVELHQNN